LISARTAEVVEFHQAIAMVRGREDSMAESVQTYKNHSRRLPTLLLSVFLVLLLHFVNQVRHVWVAPSWGAGFGALVAFAVLCIPLTARQMALTVQDRVIRLEMRLRLMDVLPADLKPRIRELTRQQLVALRFACDAELPDLVREVLAGQLKSSKEIKLRVKDWQGDFLRA
jgi:uncharacterized protein DUF6526